MYRGWGRFDLLPGDARGRRISELRLSCARAFRALAESDLLDLASSGTTGQHGFTRDGNESVRGPREVRSHLVIHQPVRSGNPLAKMQPLFYGSAAPVMDEYADLVAAAVTLMEVLDTVTLESMELIESKLGLCFGELGGDLVLGERLLRFQWYPRLDSGDAVDLVYSEGSQRIAVRAVEVGDLGTIVRAAPHVDIGHWTWQVYASDDGLMFWDDHNRNSIEAPPGPWMYGNCCEFMNLKVRSLSAPVHWVDCTDKAMRFDRLSISYFVHARPSVKLRGLTAGQLLYDRLLRLGYPVHREILSVKQLLGVPALTEPRLLEALLAYEQRGGIPSGYAVGASRYYRVGLGRVERVQSGRTVHDSE